jgi:protein-serine/threonine kinase
MTALAAPVYDLTFGEVDEEWTWPVKPPLPRASTSGSYGYGVTVIGKGFEWEPKADKDESEDTWPSSSAPKEPSSSPSNTRTPTQAFLELSDTRSVTPISRPVPLRSHTTAGHIPRRATPLLSPMTMIAQPSARRAAPVFTTSPVSSPMSSRPGSPASLAAHRTQSPYVRSPNISRPTTPRIRRRSSQQRVSLIAGRLSLLPISDPPPRPDVPQRLVRSGSAKSFLSVASSVGPPTPNELRDEYLSGRTLSEFVIEREIGRGAYGLVKRAREMQEDGTMGVSLFSPFTITLPSKPMLQSHLWSSSKSSRLASSQIAGNGIPNMALFR